MSVTLQKQTLCPCGTAIEEGRTLCEVCVGLVNREVKRELDMLKAMNFALNKIFGPK